MPRDTQDVTVNEEGWEAHPAFAIARVSRPTSTPGAVLFDSEIRHQHYVSLTIRTAERRRDYNRDWIHGRNTLVEIDLSESQWAQLVSAGGDVPCTLSYVHDEGPIPGLPYEPRSLKSFEEIRGAADEAVAAVKKALETYTEKKTAGNLRSLRFAIENIPANLVYTSKAMAEHFEDTVTKAKADIEAMANQASINAALALANPEPQPKELS